MTPLNLTVKIEERPAHELMNADLDSVLKCSLVLILNQVMEQGCDNHLNARWYERTEGRADYRNGYYERDFLISIVKVKLKVPRTRDGQFSTYEFEKYKRADQAFVLAMMEMVVNGVSTRKVTKVVEQLCGESVSKSLVSHITKKPIVNEWAIRPLMYYKYLFVDTMYNKSARSPTCKSRINRTWRERTKQTRNYRIMRQPRTLSQKLVGRSFLMRSNREDFNLFLK